jgi:hypothetical protein
MNILLSELTDFSTYQDASGGFVPRRQFEVFMSVEQLGRRLQGIFAHDRDVATCRTLAFDAFDTLKGLTIIDLFQGCRLARAERTLVSLENALPSEVSELLLIPARRAVQALRLLQAGFHQLLADAGLDDLFLAAWPGQFSQDVFRVDNIGDTRAALGMSR